MPHSRARYAMNLLLKKLRFSPVVAIQGARQTGKSFLASLLLKDRMPQMEYRTLDQRSVAEFARSNPDTFLEQNLEALPLVIDEAQKVPELFEAVKFQVDQNRKPGRFLLLGSTEFSKLTKIRESLTGRISRIRLFPLTLGETLELPMEKPRSLFHPRRKTILRKHLLQYLERGGFPGIFAVSSKEERESLLLDWIELSVTRDAMGFVGKKIDPDLCRSILERVARLENPDLPSLSSSLKRDPRKIRSHLEVLQTLFLLHPLPAHPSGTGKTRFFLCDVALARILGAEFSRQLETWALSELLARQSYFSLQDSRISYYRNPKGSLLHFIVEEGKSVSAMKLFSEERILDRDLELLRSFREKQREKVSLYGLGSAAQDHRKERIQILEWTAIG